MAAKYLRVRVPGGGGGTAEVDEASEVTGSGFAESDGEDDAWWDDEDGAEDEDEEDGDEVEDEEEEEDDCLGFGEAVRLDLRPFGGIDRQREKEKERDRGGL